MNDTYVVRGHVPCGKLATVFSRGVVVALQQIAIAVRVAGRGHRCKALFGKQLSVSSENARHGTVIDSTGKASAVG